MAKLIETKQVLIHGVMTEVKVYAPSQRRISPQQRTKPKPLPKPVEEEGMYDEDIANLPESLRTKYFTK